MKHLRTRFTVLLLVFALVAVTASTSVTAVDINSSCTLTVSPGSEQLEELQDASVVIDLYKVADAVEVTGYDSYTYQVCDGYTSLKSDLKNVKSAEDWAGIASKAADVALPSDKGLVVKAGAVDTPLTGLSAGLYLVVARGADLEEYIVETEDNDGNSTLATIALSNSYIYTFSPALVSLPGKEAENGKFNTANSGDWLYKMSITLKPDQSPRYGQLEIVKSLLGYSAGNPATFVFGVEAVDSAGKNVYSDVVSITFSEAGTQSKLVSGIPVGATVTVTELYSGVCYDLVSDYSQTDVIVAGQTAGVSFTNEPNDSLNSGGGVTNSFSYTAPTDEELDDGGWSWTEIPHRS